jgi:hypothetical protein
MTEKIEDLKYYFYREYDGPETNIRLKNNYHKSNTNINNKTIYLRLHTIIFFAIFHLIPF